MFFGDLNRKEIQEREDICTADLLCSTIKTNQHHKATILQ